MSAVVEDTDAGALAAEYVLGTAGSEERAQAQALLGVDEGFSDKVRFWERRFGELHLMVDPVDPDAQVWTRIKDKLPGTAQNPPLPPAEPAPAEEAHGLFADTAVAPPASPVEAVVAEAPAAPDTPADIPAPAIAPVESSAAAASSETALPPSAVTAGLAEALERELAAALTPAALARAAPEPAASAPEAGLVATPATLRPAPITAASAPFPSAPRAPLVTGDDSAALGQRGRRRWRAFSVLLILVVLALGGLLAVWRFAPELVPPMLQPIQVLRAIGIAIETGPPPRPPAPPESRFDE